MGKKAVSENIIKLQGRSFHFRGGPVYYKDEIGYHVHPEMELMAIRGGGGVCTINDVSDNFTGFDVVFVPANIPHCWVLDPQLCDASGMVDDWYCQFMPAFLKETGKLFAEMAPMTGFYLSLKQALRITGESARNVIRTYGGFRQLSDGRQLIALLELLNGIYETGEYTLVGTPVMPGIPISRQRMRFHVINKLITENYGRQITLAEAAAAVGMNKTAFCNAFKASSDTTFNNYLINYRLQAAARLLSTTMLNVSEIAYKVGFNDLPHFTRTFTKRYNVSPSAYRRLQKENDGNG